jgi:hypothetical protein
LADRPEAELVAPLADLVVVVANYLAVFKYNQVSEGWITPALFYLYLKMFLTMTLQRQRILKLFGSLAIAAHLAAIFIAPASVPPASPLEQTAWEFCRPYLQAANLNHGYHFFAPEPGESTLLSFVGKTATGTIRHGVIPDKQLHRPRLLYHRYFMLTEYLGSLDETDPHRQDVVNSFARQLLREYQLQEIELKLVRHRPSRRQEILIGADLQASQTYEYQPLGTFTWPNTSEPQPQLD